MRIFKACLVSILIFPYSRYTSYFSCRITSRRVCAFQDVVFLDIVDLDENPDNSLVLAKLSADEAPPAAAGKKSGGRARARGKYKQGQNFRRSLYISVNWPGFNQLDNVYVICRAVKNLVQKN